MTSIVAHYDATKWASVSGTKTGGTLSLTTTLPASVLGTAKASASSGSVTVVSTTTLSIATFKGEAAPTGGLKAMAAVGGLVLGVAALL